MEILIVDDHQIVIDGLRGLLSGQKNITQIHEAYDGANALKLVKEESIDLMILDVNLPDKNGFEICQELKANDNCPKIIALTMYGNAAYINKMIKSGADGYLLKNTGKEELINAIQTVMNGERYFNAKVTDILISGLHKVKKPKTSDFIQKLTRREKEILKLIMEEHTTDEIAGKLFISSTTVITHRKSLLRKLNSKNVAGLVKKAIEFGLLDE